MPQLQSIRLFRHGFSEANAKKVNPEEVGDCNIKLDPIGVEQAREAGRCLGRERLEKALIYTSPYTRTRETTKWLLEGANASDLRVFEDPRLREVEHGYKDVEEQEPKRAIHGWFYYRFEGGESPADCYDRTSAALESIMRQVERKNAEHVVIISHGLTIRCFVARFLHLTVEEFESMANPRNCDQILIKPKEFLNKPLFTNGRWGVEGIRLRPKA